jgi:hypothetical protein
MATGVTERVPIKIVRKASGGAPPVLALEAERFMGVLRHPVSRGDMLRKFGLDGPGCRITARWCEEAPDEHPVQAGDLLELEGKTYELLGTHAMPGCFIELYVEGR